MREHAFKNGFSLPPVYLPVPYSNIPYCPSCDPSVGVRYGLVSTDGSVSKRQLHVMSNTVPFRP